VTDDSRNAQTDAFPRIGRVGLDGMLVSVGDALSEPANRAALAFRGALDHASPAGVGESATSLVSTFLRFDALLDSRDWYAADLPGGRTLWRIPTVYGTDLAPQLAVRRPRRRA